MYVAEFDLGLDKLLSTLDRGQKAADTGRLYVRSLNYLGNKGLKYAKENTSVITGRLRRGWAFEINPFSREVTLYNNVDYAGPVNDGHRIVRKGKTVGTVPPQHMLEKALMQVKAHDLATAQRMALDDLKKELGW